MRVDVEAELREDSLLDVIRSEFQVEVVLEGVEDGVYEAVDFGYDFVVGSRKRSAQDVSVAVRLRCSAEDVLGGGKSGRRVDAADELGLGFDDGWHVEGCSRVELFSLGRGD